MTVRIKRSGQGVEKWAAKVKAAVSKPIGVSVGVHEDAGAHDESDGLTVAEIYAVHEFGSSDGRIPERSTLRATFEQNRKRYVKALTKIAADQVLDPSNQDLKAKVGRVGEAFQNDVQAAITDLSEPGNAPSTIVRKKGSDNPLIDTGQMVNSVRWNLYEGKR